MLRSRLVQPALSILVPCFAIVAIPMAAHAWSTDTVVSDASASFIGDQGDTGISLSNSGDLDGDGFDDILIGASCHSQPESLEGKVHVVFGRASGWSMDTPLSLADASFLGIVEDAQLGADVEIVGDVDGDGLDDFLASAPMRAGMAGIVYLVLGSAAGWAVDTDIHGADSWFVGEAEHDFAYAVAGAGDVNGDGLGDFLIGAVHNGEAASMAGQVYLFLGRSDVWDQGTSVTEADASFLGEFQDDRASALRGGGDVNGDGLDDILIGAAGYDASESAVGKTYLVLGRTDGWAVDTPLSTADASFIGQGSPWDRCDQSGQAGGLGDYDGDGLADILIGAPGHQNYDETGGRAYVIAGRTDGWETGQSLGGHDATMEAEQHDDHFGSSLSFVGDVDGNGVDDILIGAFTNGENGFESGQSYLYLGGSSVFDDTLLPQASFQGEVEEDRTGSTVAGGGDVNGDGYADFLIASIHNSEGGDHLDGQVYLFLGWDGCLDGDGDGYEDCNDDCHDGDPDVNPGMDEVCDDHFDNDCDGLIDGNDPECEGEQEEPEPSDCQCSGVSSKGAAWTAPVAALSLLLVTVRRRRSG